MRCRRSAGVELDVPDDLMVVADRLVLDRVVSNLLTNAERYGAEPIVLSAGASDTHLRITVEDRGEGVDEALRSHLFERFSRTDSANVGSGLGLAIARAYARAHGGDVIYDPGERGARFTLLIPQGSEPGSADPGEQARADVVDESADMQPFEAPECADTRDVVANARLLVGGRGERQIGGLRAAGLADRPIELVIARGDHSTLGVRDHHEALDPEQVSRDQERRQHFVRDAATRVADDLRVARLEPQHRQRLDP